MQIEAVHLTIAARQLEKGHAGTVAHFEDPLAVAQLGETELHASTIQRPEYRPAVQPDGIRGAGAIELAGDEKRDVAQGAAHRRAATSC